MFNKEKTVTFVVSLQGENKSSSAHRLITYKAKEEAGMHKRFNDWILERISEFQKRCNGECIITYCNIIR